MEQVQAERVQVDWEQVEQEQVEQELLFRHLKPVKTSYHHNLCCMDSTCQSILNHQQIGTRGSFPGECLLVLQLTWNQKNIVSPFNLRKPSHVKPPCWGLLLPEGQPEFEQAHKHPSDFHPKTCHTLLPLSNQYCSKTPSQQSKPHSRVNARLSLPWFHPLSSS